MPVGNATGTNRHYCDGTLGDAWSGNFLNWATMTRIDIVRKILYGGRREVDVAGRTVLRPRLASARCAQLRQVLQRL